MRRFVVRHLVLEDFTLFFFFPYEAVFSQISFEISQLFPSLPFHMANTIGIKLCIYKQCAILIDFQHCSSCSEQPERKTTCRKFKSEIILQLYIYLTGRALTCGVTVLEVRKEKYFYISNQEQYCEIGANHIAMVSFSMQAAYNTCSATASLLMSSYVS